MLYFIKEYISELKKFVKNKILIAFDEIQSGFGRTGKKFGFQHYIIKPDLICCGKYGWWSCSFSNWKKRIMDLPTVGSMSSTHSANPIACSAGIAVLREINKKLVSKTESKGKF